MPTHPSSAGPPTSSWGDHWPPGEVEPIADGDSMMHPRAQSRQSDDHKPGDIQSSYSGYALELGRCVGDFAASLAIARDEQLHDTYSKELEKLHAEIMSLRSALRLSKSESISTGERSAHGRFFQTAPATITVEQRVSAAMGLPVHGEGERRNSASRAPHQRSGDSENSPANSNSMPIVVPLKVPSIPVAPTWSNSSHAPSEQLATPTNASPGYIPGHRGSLSGLPPRDRGLTTFSRGSNPASAISLINGEQQQGMQAYRHEETHTSMAMRVQLTRALESNTQLAFQAAMSQQPSLRGQSRNFPREELKDSSGTHRTLSERTTSLGIYVLEPDGSFRAVWESFALAALLYDSVLFPFVLAWEPEQTTAMQVGKWTTIMIWTLDLALNFMTGYLKGDGSAEMDLKMIARHYFYSWFWCDLLTVAADWLAVCLELVNSGREHATTNAVRLVRLFKVNRLMRTCAIGLRIFRLSKKWAQSTRIPRATSTSTAVTFSVQAIKILALILWINHLFTCVWYAIGARPRSNTDTGQSWLDDTATIRLDIEDQEVVTYRDTHPLYQYTTAMHWSMTQMTPGSMQVFPTNSTERVCNIVCLVVGLLFGTTLVSQLSSKLVQFNMNRQEELRKTGLLRQFLRENQIQAALAARVYKQITDRMSIRKRLTEDKVPGLAQLSVNLRMELRQRMYLPHLHNHPLFSAWSQLDTTVLKDLCCFGSIVLTCLSGGEELFTPSSCADIAYLFIKGSLKYSRTGSHHGQGNSASAMTLAMKHGLTPSPSNTKKELDASGKHDVIDHQLSMLQEDEGNVVFVEDGAWVSEIVLYMTWQHLGTLESVRESELLGVPYEGFLQVLRNHHHCKVAEMTLDWCMAFAQQTEADHDVDYTLFDIGVHHASVVMAMPDRSRNIIHASCLEQLEDSMAGSALWWRKGAGDLEEELRKAVCVLTIDGKGEFVRTVTVVTARLLYQGRFMVRLATKDEAGGWVPNAMLPGTKMKQGEEASKVAERVVEEDLSKFASITKFESCTQDSKKKESGSYGVKSQYLKLIFTANLESLPDGLDREDLTDGSILDDMMPHVMEDKRGRPILYGWVTDDELSQLEQGAFAEEIRFLANSRHRASEHSGKSISRPSLQQRIMALGAADGVDPLASQSHTRWKTFFHIKGQAHDSEALARTSAAGVSKQSSSTDKVEESHCVSVTESFSMAPPGAELRAAAPVPSDNSAQIRSKFHWECRL